MSVKVTVLLPVYNCPTLVGQAIESILGQTFQDFELIVIDDGSTDGTPAVLARYGQPKVKLISQPNRGLAATLNRGIELAQGRYIARQDQDDVSLPHRLAKQVSFMEANAGCALVGTWADIWKDNENTGRQHRHPASNGHLQYELLLDNPFVHSSVMMRRSAVLEVGGYSVDSQRQPPEDYELWSRLARKYEVANIPEVLHIYREIVGSMSREGLSPFKDHLTTIASENIAHAAAVHSSNPHATNIAALVHGALHRIQGKPDLQAMTNVFRCAAQAVVPIKERAHFGRHAARRIGKLRFAYPELFGVGLLERRLAAMANRASFLFKRLH